MSQVAFVFPGQASQRVGMGKELCEHFPSVDERFARASELLSFDLKRLCLEGPADDLTLTTNAQPAILTLSVACWDLLDQKGVRPDCVAGHSLGEYSALVASRALAFDDAVRLVRRRAELMHAAPEGTMAAIAGLTEEQVRQVCQESSVRGVVSPANYNGGGQIVVSGEVEAVEEAMRIASQMGALRTVRLDVSGAFHSPLMAHVQQELAVALRGTPLSDAVIPVVANANAQSVTKAGEIRALLVEQVTSSVLWEAIVKRMIAEGVSTFVEVGPGRVLSGLIRRIDRQTTLLNVEDIASLEKTVAALKDTAT